MRHFISCFFLFIGLPLIAICQPSFGGQPISFTTEFQALSEVSTIPLVKLQPKTSSQESSQVVANRISTVPVPVDFNLTNAGQWLSLPNGDRLWRFQIEVPAAKALLILYDSFFLPRGGRLYVYSPDRKQVLGAYTAANNGKSEEFLTGFIQGESLIVEYFEPKFVKGQGRISINRVDYADAAFQTTISDHPFQVAASIGFGAAADCNININCAAGNDWQTQERGICRVMMVMEEGTVWCTGNLINNTREDGTPYVLSAFHCVDGFTPKYDLWRFDFDYESFNCNNPDQEPTFRSVLGCQRRSAWRNTDLLLLEIDAPIPSAYQVYFNGWDIRSDVPSSGTLIHHPLADIKKISRTNLSSSIQQGSIVWNNDVTTPPNHHLKTSFQQEGTFQIGSSGGALFNQDQRIVGQLHGGFPDTLCRITTAYFGRLTLSWEGGGTAATRLRDWLDPINTGATSLNGIENPVDDNTISLQGYVRTEDEVGIADVEIWINEELHTSTDFTGYYLIEETLSTANSFLQARKNSNPSNGLTNFDMIKIQKHILNTEPLPNNYRLIAADVNKSQTISNLDLLRIKKVILGIDTAFQDNTSWRFIPSQFDMTASATADFEYNFPEQIPLEDIQANTSDLNFIGIKVGDVNLSATPDE